MCSDLESLRHILAILASLELDDGGSISIKKVSDLLLSLTLLVNQLKDDGFDVVWRHLDDVHYPRPQKFESEGELFQVFLELEPIVCLFAETRHIAPLRHVGFRILDVVFQVCVAHILYQN